MTPKVSICIPAYLQTQFLKRTLDSILLQDFDDYEIIITDDSPNETVENLVCEYSFGPKLLYVRNKHQLGSPANWNEAIRLSKGEYIKLLHHDDWFASSVSLSEFVEMLDSNPGSGFAFSGATALDAQTGKTRHHYASNKDIERLRVEPTCLFLGNFIGAPSLTIIRRSTFSAFDERLIWFVDIAQYIQILRNTCFVATQKPLVVSISNGRHQITNSCVGNKQLNVYESFYLYDAIRAYIPIESINPYFDHIKHIIYHFNIQSKEEISQQGYDGPLPEEILLALNSSYLVRLLERVKWYLLRRSALFKRHLFDSCSINNQAIRK